jgi:hypothetical protein
MALDNISPPMGSSFISQVNNSDINVKQQLNQGAIERFEALYGNESSSVDSDNRSYAANSAPIISADLYVPTKPTAIFSLLPNSVVKHASDISAKFNAAFSESSPLKISDEALESNPELKATKDLIDVIQNHTKTFMEMDLLIKFSSQALKSVTTLFRMQG